MVLGPLHIEDREERLFIGTRKMETALAALILKPDQVVTFDQLIYEIWGEHPPRRAAAAVHVYISQLRKFLNRPGRRDSPIITRSPGYLLHRGADEIDFEIFLQLVDRGRSHRRELRYESALDYFDQALQLWSGPVLGGVINGPICEALTTRLMEVKLECTEMMIDTRLELGYHRAVIGDLYALITENPWHEAFYGQLMLALHRSGRQADALHVYQMARKNLHEELGLEPCRALRNLQRAILTADHRLEHRFPVGSRH